MNYYGLDWIGTILGLASIYFMGRQDRTAFILRIAASVFWAAFGVVAQTPACIFANAVAVLLCFNGIRRRPEARPRPVPATQYTGRVPAPSSPPPGTLDYRRP